MESRYFCCTWLFLVCLSIPLSPGRVFAQYDRAKVKQLNEQHQELGVTAAVLMKSDLRKQEEAVKLIRQTAKEIKKIQDPYDIQGAMLELQMAMGGHLGSPRSAPNDKQLELISNLVKQLQGMVDPDAMRKLKAQSAEGRFKGNLGAIRSALSIFYGDKEGVYPSDPNTELTPKYMSQIPEIHLEHHPASKTIRIITQFKGKDLKSAVEDTGRWTYIGDPASPNFGSIFIDCSHNDSKDRVWHQY